MWSISLVHDVLDARRGGDERKIDLALEPLPDDLHVQETEEPTTEAETERAGRLGLIADRCVVELHLLEAFPKVLEIVALHREQTAEHHGLGVAVTLKRGSRRAGGVGDGLSHPRLADVLDARDEITHFAGAERDHRRD